MPKKSRGGGVSKTRRKNAYLRDYYSKNASISSSVSSMSSSVSSLSSVQRRENDRIRKASRIEQETPEERENRLKDLRERSSRRIAEETYEERESRLADKRINSQRMRASVQFDSEILTFAEHSCCICTKMCYLKQTRNLVLNSSILLLIPSDFVDMRSILTCNRCAANLEKSKIPSQAYWNKMEVDKRPDEITCLSEMELKLLARAVPFVRMIKLGGRFGQFGFKGQAVLFGQRIEELAEQLPLQLNNAGVIIVAESLEGLDNIKEFQIDIGRLQRGLEWLKQNNHLYFDVQINLPDAPILLADICEILVPENNSAQIQSTFNEITKGRAILRGSFHQGDQCFGERSRGKQCTANSAAAIALWSIIPPSSWKKETLDTALMAGNNLYLDSTRHEEEPGYLSPHDLEEYFSFRGHDVNLLIGSDTDSVHGFIKQIPSQINLERGLEMFFDGSQTGILVSDGNSVAILKIEESFWLFDSHSRGPKGRISNDGAAFVMRFPSIILLASHFKSNLSSGNHAFSITRVDVQILHHEVSQDASEEFLKEPDIQPSLGAIPTSLLLPTDNLPPTVESYLDVPETSDANPTAQLKRRADPPINISKEPRSEEIGFWFLFPNGKNGLNEERLVRITPLDYFQNRIMGKDRRFWRIDYLFYALSVYEFYRALYNIGVCCRMRLGGNFIENIAENIHLNMRGLRGSNAYWQTATSELVAMLRNLGPAQWFITLSANDLNWPDILKALLIADNRPNEDPETLTFKQRQHLVESYPVVVSRQFMVRFNTFMRWLKKDSSILHGKVVDHWWRVEFQNRGSPHIHMMVWTDNSTSFETPEGIELINSVVQCSLTDDPELNELVKRLQIHKHTQTCYKNREEQRCRFGFPRRQSNETLILGPDEAISNNGRFCVLKRSSEEMYVNNYNPKILQTWKANMDIQPCGSVQAVAYYIAKYAAKSEPRDVGQAVRDALKNTRDRGGSIRKQLFAVSMVILNHRQVSACECAFRLCHLMLKESSRKSIFLNTCKPEQRYRMMRLQEGDVYNNIFDRYENRPDDLEELSLAEFAIKYEPAYGGIVQSEEDGDAEMHQELEDAEEDESGPTNFIRLKGRLGQMKIRKRNAVLRTRHFTQLSDKEGYFYSLLVSHVAFRKESELLHGYNTAQGAFYDKRDLLRPLIPGGCAEEFNHIEEELNAAIAQIQALEFVDEYPPNVEDINIGDNRDFDVLGFDDGLDLGDDVQDGEVQRDAMSDEEFNRLKNSMNSEQRRLFNIIISAIRSDLQPEVNFEPLRMFVTGGGGCGKTFMLKLLVEQIKRCYEPTQDVLSGSLFVEVGAYTGVAARLVNGKTLHSLFNLKVEKNSATTHRPLTGIRLEEARRKWRTIRWLIIDEVSMCSYEVLRSIHLRLQEVKNSSDLFGGINVIYLGDLMQLPPVKGSRCFSQPSSFAGEIHLWQAFKFFELQENMRQRSDQDFIGILNNLRFGQLTMEQIDTLLGRTTMWVPEVDEFDHGATIRIFPKNHQVDSYNQKRVDLARATTRTYTIKAKDRSVEGRTYGDTPRDEYIPKKADGCGGLSGSLELGIGFRVLLRRNINVSQGLVNGALGIVRGFHWTLMRSEPSYPGELPVAVLVEFDDPSVGMSLKNSEGFVPISPSLSIYDGLAGYGKIERQMVPFILAWAVTTHKMQGATLDRAVIHLGHHLFAKGQAYVSLSRVKSLIGVCISELDVNKLRNNPHDLHAMREMERLRESDLNI